MNHLPLMGIVYSFWLLACTVWMFCGFLWCLWGCTCGPINFILLFGESCVFQFGDVLMRL